VRGGEHGRALAFVQRPASDVPDDDVVREAVLQQDRRGDDGRGVVSHEVSDLGPDYASTTVTRQVARLMDVHSVAAIVVRYSARNSSAVLARAAWRPGMAATRLASTSAPSASRLIVASGTVGRATT